MNLSTTRVRIAAATGVLALAARLTYLLLAPKGTEGSTTQSFTAARSHQGLYFASTWADMIAFTAAAFTCITLTHLIRGRGARLTAVGGWLTTASLLAISTNTLGLAQGVLATQPDQPAMTHALDQINSSPALAPLMVLAVLSIVAPVVFAFGLMRAHLVRWWYPAIAILAAAAFLALNGDHGRGVNLLGFLPLAALWVVWIRLLATRAAHPVESPKPTTALAAA